MLFRSVGYGESKSGVNQRVLRITVPEDLNFNHMFDDLFEKYTRSCDVISVKTANMGSLYKLQYQLELINPDLEKEFMDELRCRNGNLEISMSRQEARVDEL